MKSSKWKKKKIKCMPSAFDLIIDLAYHGDLIQGKATPRYSLPLSSVRNLKKSWSLGLDFRSGTHAISFSRGSHFDNLNSHKQIFIQDQCCFGGNGGFRCERAPERVPETYGRAPGFDFCSTFANFDSSSMRFHQHELVPQRPRRWFKGKRRIWLHCRGCWSVFFVIYWL